MTLPAENRVERSRTENTGVADTSPAQERSAREGPPDEGLPNDGLPDEGSTGDSPDNPVLGFLLSRRSRPAKVLSLPAPDHGALKVLLTAAARVPDHGKLQPWRFIVLARPALARLAELAATRAVVLGLDDAQAGKCRAQFADSPLAVAVVASPRASDKIPEIEQTLSAGAVCLSLLNAALASGWGANWLTGIPAHDRVFVQDGLGLSGHEWVAGFIHIGTATAVPPDRPRPDLGAIVEWVEA